MKSIKVNIGGREYDLSGDDEQLVRQTAREVDSHLHQLTLQNSELSNTSTLPILAALNIAESKILAESSSDMNKRFVVDELDKLSGSLKQFLEKLV